MQRASQLYADGHSVLLYCLHPSVIRPLIWKLSPHSNRSTFITLHLPAEHTDTSMEADQSDAWSTPPLPFSIFYFISSFLNRPAFSSPPSALLTSISSPHFVVLPFSSPLLLTFPKHPQREEDCRQFRHNRRENLSVILLMVFKHILAFSSNKTEIQLVCIAACGDES